jgi:actin related protein 2/3 complex subunit 1A/1B
LISSAGLDWSPVTNYLVSCSHDRNAFVWTEKSAGVWKPTLAILRISRAALCCKWSPNGKKFAVGSGSKTVPVCQFDAEQDWWTSKIINKKKGSAVQHKSSIVSVAWHPNSQFLATASTDKKCRVFCAHNEDLDGATRRVPCACVLCL